MKKEFHFVCIALFLLIFGTYISGTLLVPYAKTLGGTSLSIGVIYSGMYAVRLIFGTPIGRWSQKKGAKTMLLYSLMLYPFIAAAYYISWNIPSLLFARLLHGVASAMMLPMAMAYIGELSPAGQEGRYMGIYNSVFFAASAAGPVAGGLIYDRVGISQAFIVLFFLSLLSLAIMAVFARGKRKTVAAAPAPPSSGILPQLGLGATLKNRRALALGIFNIVSAILFALLGASFTQLALSGGMDMDVIGLLIALYNIVIGATQVPFGRLADRFDKLKLAAASGIAVALVVFLLPAVNSAWAIAALLVLSGIFTAMNLAATTALSALLGKENGMSLIMGFLGSANSAGTIAGYLALGGISDLFGIHSAFYLTGIVFPAGLLLFAWLWKLPCRSH